MAHFRHSTPTEQSIIMQCLSHNPARLFVEESALGEARTRLQADGVIRFSDTLTTLSGAYRGSLLKGLFQGLPSAFEPLTVNEDDSSDSIPFEQNWVEVYAYLLRKVSGTARSGLSETLKAVFEAQRLVIPAPGERENDRRAGAEGFGFLVDSLSNQVNRVLFDYVSYLDQGRARPAAGLADLADLLQLFCHLCFLPAGKKFKVHFSKLPLERSQILRIFDDLGSAGLLKYSSKTESLRLSPLLSNFLSNTQRNSDLFPLHLIAENDFKIYLYSEFEYAKYLLSLFADVKALFPNSIVASLNDKKLAAAYAQGISADMVIGFLEANCHPKVAERRIRELQSDAPQREFFSQNKQKETTTNNKPDRIPFNFEEHLRTIAKAPEAYLRIK